MGGISASPNGGEDDQPKNTSTKVRTRDDGRGPRPVGREVEVDAFIAGVHATRAAADLKSRQTCVDEEQPEYVSTKVPTTEKYGVDAKADAYITRVHATRAAVDLESRQTCVDEEQPEYVSTKVPTSEKYGVDAKADAYIARVHSTRAAVDLESRQTCVAGHDCFSASPNGRDDQEHPKDVLAKDRPIDEESGCDIDTRAGTFIAKVKATHARRHQEP